MLLAAKAEVEQVGKERDEVRPGRRSHRSRSVTLSSRVLSTLRLHAAAQVHLSFALRTAAHACFRPRVLVCKAHWAIRLRGTGQP